MRHIMLEGLEGACLVIEDNQINLMTLVQHDAVDLIDVLVRYQEESEVEPIIGPLRSTVDGDNSAINYFRV